MKLDSVCDRLGLVGRQIDVMHQHRMAYLRALSEITQWAEQVSRDQEVPARVRGQASIHVDRTIALLEKHSAETPA